MHDDERGLRGRLESDRQLTVSAEFDGSDEQERKELSVSQAVEIAAGALDAIPQLSVFG